MSDIGTTYPDPLEVIVTALTDGPRTAGQLAEHLGIPYSTLTPRLRVLEADGRAERVKDPVTRVTVWQTTAGTMPALAATTDGTTPTPPPVTASAPDPAITDPDTSTGTPPAAVTEAPTGVVVRRPKGSIPAAIVAVVRTQPQATFKISQLRKALDGVSAGAIANAVSKLVVSGQLRVVCEKPVTVQAT